MDPGQIKDQYTLKQESLGWEEMSKIAWRKNWRGKSVKGSFWYSSFWKHDL